MTSPASPPPSHYLSPTSRLLFRPIEAVATGGCHAEVFLPKEGAGEGSKGWPVGELALCPVLPSDGSIAPPGRTYDSWVGADHSLEYHVPALVSHLHPRRSVVSSRDPTTVSSPSPAESDAHHRSCFSLLTAQQAAAPTYLSAKSSTSSTRASSAHQSSTDSPPSQYSALATPCATR